MSGSKCLKPKTLLWTENWRHMMMALNAKLKTHDDGSERQKPKTWLLTPNLRHMMMALKAKLWRNSGSECLKLKTWLWTPNWRKDSEHQTEDMALNAKLKTYDDGSECQTKDTWWWLWMPNYGEIVVLNTWNWRHGSERQTEDMTLNAWNWKRWVALNA